MKILPGTSSACNHGNTNTQLTSNILLGCFNVISDCDMSLTAIHTVSPTLLHVHVLHVPDCYTYRSSCEFVLDLKNLVNVEITLGQGGFSLGYEEIVTYCVTWTQA